MSGHKNPNVTRAVKPSASGSFYAQGDSKKGFYFELVCGHRSPCKSREKNHWGERKIVPSPEKAEWRPCEECKTSLLKAGKPLPPCPLCRGAGEMRSERHTISRGQHVASFSISRCPACFGKTTNPKNISKPDLRGILS